MTETAKNLGAFCDWAEVHLPGKAGGPLSGLRFAVKDLYDVEGHVTGCGNPDWLATHEPAESTAPAVTRLVEAGATMIGKTITDELAFSLFGENFHYGAPVNTRAPDRVPGGSSSGSAAAVAGGLVDFAVGSDTGGSVRVPASFCGILGIRPTHGRISIEGCMPLASTFDTVGWFANDPELLERVGRVLLDEPAGSKQPGRGGVLIAEDAFDLLEPSSRDPVSRALGGPETDPRGAAAGGAGRGSRGLAAGLPRRQRPGDLGGARRLDHEDEAALRPVHPGAFRGGLPGHRRAGRARAGNARPGGRQDGGAPRWG